MNMDGDEEDEGIEITFLSDESSQLSQRNGPGNKQSAKSEKDATFIKLWNSLACCDGLCGHTLGHSVKEGSDVMSLLTAQ